MNERGADIRQIVALVAAAVRLDLRGTRTRRRGVLGFPPMVSMLVTYAVIGTVLAVGLGRSADVFTFALLALSAGMFMTAITVIMEYSAVVVSPDDYGVLAHRPISSRTYFWAKIANLMFYVVSTALALNAPAAVFGAVRYGGGWGGGLAYAVLSVIACSAAAALVVLLYSTALKLFDYTRFSTAITYIHTLATLALTFGYVLLPRMLMRQEVTISLTKGAWVYVAPPAWYAGIVEWAHGVPSPESPALAALAVGSASLLFWAALRTVSLEYSQRISELATSADDTRHETTGQRVRSGYARAGLVLCRNEVERAGFDLMLRYMARDRKLRLRIYPAYGLPLAVYLFGLLTGSLRDPFGPASIDPGFPVTELIGFYCVFITVFFASSITQSEKWQASWLFFASPLCNRADLVTGARTLIVWRYMIPFFAVLFVLLSFAMPITSAAAYLLITFLLSLLAFSLLAFASPYMPLSQSIERTRQARQFGFIFLLGLAMGALMALKEAIRQSTTYGAIAVGLLIVLVVLVEVALRRRLASRLAGTEFVG